MPISQRRASAGRIDGFDHRRNADALVFPGEIIVPVLPAGRLADAARLLARQAQIGDRDDPLVGCEATVAVGKSIELLDIAERMMRLAFDPGAQARLQRAMRKLERARGQGARVLQGQHTRLARCDGRQAPPRGRRRSPTHGPPARRCRDQPRPHKAPGGGFGRAHPFIFLAARAGQIVRGLRRLSA